MKGIKRMALLLSLIMVMTAVLVMPASAESTGVVESTGSSDWTYTATLVPQSGTLDGHYLLVVFKQTETEGTPTMPSFTADDILYIDQVTVSDASSVVFDDWAPKSYSGGSAWIIGADLKEFIGWLEAHGVSFSGTIGYLSTAKSAPTAVLSVGSTEIELDVNESTLSTGSSSVVGSSIPDGEYTLTISKKGYLPYTTTVVVSGENVTMADIQLLAGDADEDGKFINFSDLQALLSDYKKDGVADSAANFNEDEYVNFADLSIIISNYKKTY